MYYMGTAEQRAEAIAEVCDSLTRCNGVVRKAAVDLCISHMHLYRIIRDANLWHVVDTARLNWVRSAIRATPDWLVKTRKELDR